jgi:acetyl-CoA acetyltransferase family protein
MTWRATLSEVFLYDAVRTPFGKYGGALAGTRPDDLAALVVRTIVERSEVEGGWVDEIVFGNANGAGEDNRNVGRMAGLLAGLPTSVPASTVNRLCGSSLDAAILGARQLALGESELVVVGGVESMSRAPWVLPKPPRPFPAGNAELVSTTLGWRLVNPELPGAWTVSLGEATEQLREREGVSREDQDEFALRSHRAAAEAWDSGFYDDQVVTVPGVDLRRDESIRGDTTLDRLAALAPVFRSDGTVTAGNASPLNDGASAALLGSAAAGERLGRSPVARVAGWGAAANEPQFFGIAPVEAAHTALRRSGITWRDVGAVELNEAFAAQSLACVRAWDVDPAVMNRYGGAIAIGHPLGASGTRILGTLARTLEKSGERWGVAAICIGVGQGLAVVLENPTAA